MYLHGICGEYLYMLEEDSCFVECEHISLLAYYVANKNLDNHSMLGVEGKLFKSREKIAHAISPLLALLLLVPSRALGLLPAALRTRLEAAPEAMELI